MQFNISIATTSGNKTRLDTALHLIIAFALFITGVFLLMYQTVVDKLETAERAKLVVLPVEGVTGWIPLVLAIVLFVLVLFRNRWMYVRSIVLTLRLLELIVMAGLAIFAYMHQIYMPGFLYALISGLVIHSFIRDATADKVPQVFVGDRGVSFPKGAINKTLQWHEVERILLKHGVLTIDCSGNRLYQWNTMETNKLNIPQFEEFCNAQIEGAKEKRVKNDW